MAKERQGDPAQVTNLSKRWPVKLGEHTVPLGKALAMDPEFAEWPEGKRVLGAAQSAAIGKILVAANHPLLKNQPIAYLWVKGELGTEGRRTMLGKARVLSLELGD